MSDLNTLFQTIKQRDPNQAVFHQAVEEVFGSLKPCLTYSPKPPAPRLPNACARKA